MLSGGQMRRIELSRLLLLKPDIVIFDEPAIGLDIETEKVIQQVLEHHFSTTTVFIVHTVIQPFEVQHGVYISKVVILKR